VVEDPSMQPGTDSVSQLVLYEPYSMEGSQEPVFTWGDGTANLELFHDDGLGGRLKWGADDDAGSSTGESPSGVREDALTMGCQVLDQDGQNHRVMSFCEDASPVDTSGGLGFGAVNPGGPMWLAGADCGMQLALLHHTAIDADLLSYLWELVHDRSVYPVDLPIEGTLETGLSRTVPEYVEDAEFWWTAAQHVHQAAGTPVETLPDHSGADSFRQGSLSSQASISGGGLGDSSDYLTLDGDDYYHRTFSDPGTSLTMWVTFRLVDGESSAFPIDIAGPNSQFRIYTNNGITDVYTLLRNDSGSFSVNGFSNVPNNTWITVVFAFNRGSPNTLTSAAVDEAGDQYGGVKTDTQSGSLTLNNITVGGAGSTGSNAMDGGLKSVGVKRGTPDDIESFRDKIAKDDEVID
jgi:hypothetical protein